MKYRELEYSRTFNLGDYQSERITLKIDLDETEDLDECYRTTKARCKCGHFMTEHLDF